MILREEFNKAHVEGLNLGNQAYTHYLLTWSGSGKRVPEGLKIGHSTICSMNGGAAVSNSGEPVAMYARLTDLRDTEQAAILSVKDGSQEPSVASNAKLIRISSDYARLFLTPGSELRNIVSALTL